MIVFDGTYRWNPSGKRSGRRRNWDLCCDLRVIDLTTAIPEVVHLRRFLVVANWIRPALTTSSIAETLGKRIFRDFHLNSRNVLWIETDWDHPEKLLAASFHPVAGPYEETDYEIRWREAMPNEKELVDAFLPKGWFLAYRTRPR
uniref:Uncharacterized protein n=1 Tax=Desulfatirhabdium butyrativorans TaxID=340467 RepID=A0A7C4RUC6_9BACT